QPSRLNSNVEASPSEWSAGVRMHFPCGTERRGEHLPVHGCGAQRLPISSFHHGVKVGEFMRMSRDLLVGPIGSLSQEETIGPADLQNLTIGGNLGQFRDHVLIS